MQIIVLLGIMAAWALGDPQTSRHLAPAGWWTPLALAGYVIALAIMGRLHAARARKAMAPTASPADRRRAAAATSGENLCLLGGFAGVLWAGGVRWLLATPIARWPLAPTLALLAPFVAGLLIVWLNHYRLHRHAKLQAAAALPDGPPPTLWTLRQYLAFNLRTHLLMILVPVSLIMLASDLLELAHPLLPEAMADSLVAVGMVISAGLVFLLAPVIIVHIWRTAPMENSPLLAKLKAMCDRLHLRYRRILIWQSDGVLVNAGVMGLIARVRYILLSDGLIEQMPHEQVEAVFAHEAAHVTNRHILYSGMFMVGTGLWVFVLAESADRLLGWPDSLVNIASLVTLAAAWGLGFGWLSRLFERQADVAGAWEMGRPDNADGETPDGTITPQGAMIFARSLESVARLNGMPPRRFNWRHGSIANRVSHVLWLADAGKSRATIDRLVRLVKVSLLASLAAGGAAAALLSLLESNT